MKKLISILLVCALFALTLVPVAYAAKADSVSGTAQVISVEAKATPSVKKAGISDLFAKIKAFFNKIINWFKNLFSGIKKIDWNPDAAPADYETSIQTGGDVEAKYLAHGPYDISYFEADAGSVFKKFEVWYPAELTSSGATYPVIVSANGSGIKASVYTTVLKHYASWGFIVIGNEDESSWAGDSSEASLAFILEQNDDPNSVLYHKVDTENIGIVGHSQGGVGVFTAVSKQPHSDMYKTAVALSPTAERVAESINWNYDISKVNIPVLMLAGTEGWFETESVIPLEDMNNMFDRLGGEKFMARRIGAEHGQMLYTADGYVTAWFMWILQGDAYAAKAFLGDSPEIMNNPLYQDQRIDLE